MNPRWLLNENFPQPSVRRLRALGWDIAAIAEGTAGVEDEIVTKALLLDLIETGEVRYKDATRLWLRNTTPNAMTTGCAPLQ